ncbi:MAG: TauD/TfdA family dioxygenase [Gammaproteobacteria bacterium]|nr:TauD/TfdA family dioxygenase [Gammaproteobacteria bacterium]MYD76693.1 TauD/TfdA family dioxygenase [Gammaproteobacteria bacterium]MYJ52611.1 TauD/TfdA family dioxygenase [Gammaproteobacteria bacterium]
MRSRTLDGPFGVEFYDVDVSRMTDGELAEAAVAQNANGVVFFRGQELDCAQHIAFANRWGDIVVNRFFERVEGYPQIAMVRKEPWHRTVVGETWHTDHSYDAEPARGSILYAREIPSRGGDTLFANMYMAYEALSPGLRRTLESLNAVHTSAHVFSTEAVQTFEEGDDRYHSGERAVQRSVHPVVIRHPSSGRKALYVNPDFTTQFEGWTVEESRPLLDYLHRHSTRDEFVVRFSWQRGTIAFWDNRAVMHKAANDYPTERRLMHRITLSGCALRGTGAE